MSHRSLATSGVMLAVLIGVPAALAQPLGTFRWQLQPFCNVVTVSVTQSGAVYTLDGYDDQCGGPQRAPLVGLATPNPDGSVGLGLNIVTVPGGRGVQVDARISLAGLSGPWTDSAGNNGTFAFSASTGGSPRPAPPGIPPAINLLADGGLLAGGTFNIGNLPASGPGTRMMWHPRKAAFRAGAIDAAQWDDANIGAYSIAVGVGTTASGGASAAMGSGTLASSSFAVAMGDHTVASGFASTAFGQQTTASTDYSMATGHGSVASGSASTAMGYQTTASGLVSTAVGNTTTAFGSYSTAMGSHTIARAANSTVMGSLAETGFAAVGSFVYGDNSTNQVVASNSPNQFLVRAAGGVVFWSTAATTFPTSPGVALFTGDSAWSTLSDVDSKENFEDLAGEDVLARLAQMPVREWNYKAQDAAIRHVGPTAQDFHAAFGLGVDPRRIGTVDADGIALAAIKALETRTRELRDENRALHAALADLRRELEALHTTCAGASCGRAGGR